MTNDDTGRRSARNRIEAALDLCDNDIQRILVGCRTSWENDSTIRNANIKRHDLILIWDNLRSKLDRAGLHYAICYESPYDHIYENGPLIFGDNEVNSWSAQWKPLQIIATEINDFDRQWTRFIPSAAEFMNRRADSLLKRSFELMHQAAIDFRFEYTQNADLKLAKTAGIIRALTVEVRDMVAKMPSEADIFRQFTLETEEATTVPYWTWTKWGEIYHVRYDVMCRKMKDWAGIVPSRLHLARTAARHEDCIFPRNWPKFCRAVRQMELAWPNETATRKLETMAALG